MEKKIKEVKNIKCDVTNCIYHTGESKCMAGAIEVGPHNARVCGDTICATFEANENNQTF